MPADLVSPEQWRQIKAAFEEAMPLSPQDRDAALAAVTDPEVRAEALALLAAHDQLGDFLEPAPPFAPEPGQRLGPYQIVERVGGGGMGEVYRARDTRLAREVAIKVLRAHFGDDAAHARFLREARAIAALSHPNVLAIFDVGEASGVPYLVTELLTGETLRARLQRAPAPSIRDALSWCAQIAHGLAAAHEAGIVHRDLKPENVFLLANDEVKLLDFGLARPELGDHVAEDQREARDEISMPGMVMGTAGYLAPEQARAGPVRAAADLFALGAILFELVTGARAFPGATASERTRAALEHEPPQASSLRPGVPVWLDQVIARCLAKEVGRRFESARDLAFALEVVPAGTLGAAAGSTTMPAAAGAAAPSRVARGRGVARLGRTLATGVALAAAVAAGFALARRPPPARPPPPPARLHALTYGGLDREPAVSPDGRFLAFTSERDGVARIWIKALDSGSETALTTGPDHAPRFSPDGNQVLFTRGDGRTSALLRTDLLGRETHKIIDDAGEGDWSPDGREVAFVRSSSGRPTIMIAKIGGGARTLHALEDRPQRGRSITQYLRWSPDGKRIAVTGLVTQPGSPQSVLLVPVDGSRPTRLPPPNRIGLISAASWDGPEALLYSQASSASGNVASGSGARLVRQPITGASATTLMWTTESSLVVDRWPGHGVVFDVRARRENLREVPRVARAERTSRMLSKGTSTDRQPVLSPDGEVVVFSSNRDGTDLDLWALDRRLGSSRRLTDHPADDWDPALSPDGRNLLWSSNRSGSFEIWIGNADGGNPRQLTHDGDAENPSRGGDWIVYGSGAPGRAGVWRIRPDGTQARQLVAGAVLPEISPDGTYVLFLQNRDPSVAVIGVASVDDGRVLPFEIKIEIRRLSTVLLGRARWTPEGDAIAFVGQDEHGASGVYLQDFTPERDTSATRIPLAGFDPERLVESFDLDRERIILAEPDRSSDVMVAEGLEP